MSRRAIPLSVALLTLATAGASSAETFIVSPSGPFRSVADAVRRVPAGATVIVRPGTYREPPILIAKPLTLAGDGRPEIQPTEPGTLVRVTASDVSIRGLILSGIAASYVEDRAAIRFDRVQRCAVEQTEIREAPYGIYISESADCRIVSNAVRGRGDRQRATGNAIHVWSSQRLTIAGNDLSGHRDGIYFEFVQDATVENNISRGNLRYGLHFMFSHHCAYRGNELARNGAGVAVMYTRDVEMSRNVFADNRGPTAYGLLLKDISNSRLEANRFSGNTVGLHIEGGGSLTITGNRFSGNGWGVRLMANSAGNRFIGNVFEGNSFDMSTNSRSTSAVVGGNWWDRYRGYDLDRDGRGDVAFHPVRLFSLLVSSQPPSVILMRSAFVDVLDAAERALPVLTPETLVDASPLMSRPR